MNYKHMQRLIEALYSLDSCPALDEYGTKIFGRPIKASIRIFRFIARFAIEDTWKWDPQDEVAAYPQVEVATYEEFCTFMLHEITHGWCYLHKETPDIWHYPTGVDEEQVCWDVSKLMCEVLGIEYHAESAERSHKFHKLVQAGDIEGLNALMETMPAHHQLDVQVPQEGHAQ